MVPNGPAALKLDGIGLGEVVALYGMSPCEATNVVARFVLARVTGRSLTRGLLLRMRSRTDESGPEARFRACAALFELLL